MNVVELNVGGTLYTTTVSTLTAEGNSKLAQWVKSGFENFPKDNEGRYFIDRNGTLFHYVLEYLRNNRLLVPDNFKVQDLRALQQEADYYGLTKLAEIILETPVLWEQPCTETCKKGFITINYKGVIGFGRDQQAEIKFRKISRINVCGRVQLLREVFHDSLNESRDPNHGDSERYTSRFFLKHTYLEQAFDQLNNCGFKMVGNSASCCGHEAFGYSKISDADDFRWLQYNEFVFYRS